MGQEQLRMFGMYSGHPSVGRMPTTCTLLKRGLTARGGNCYGITGNKLDSLFRLKQVNGDGRLPSSGWADLRDRPRSRRQPRRCVARVGVMVMVMVMVLRPPR